MQNPSKNIPLGYGWAVIAITLNYLIPLTLTVPMHPDIASWETGYFVKIASDTSSALGILTVICATLSSLINLIPQLTMASRATQATVKARMLPRALDFLSQDSTLTGTPVAAIFLNALCSMFFLHLSFDVLVVLEILCALVGLVLQFLAFLVLKHTKPHYVRPFEVMGGLLGAYLVAIPFFSLAAMLIYFDVRGEMYTVSVAGAVGVLALLGKFWYTPYCYTVEEEEINRQLEG